MEKKEKRTAVIDLDKCWELVYKIAPLLADYTPIELSVACLLINSKFFTHKERKRVAKREGGDM